MTVIHQYWHKTVFKLVLLTVVLCAPTTQALAFATITNLESPVWVQQGDIKSKLTRDEKWEVGDQITTGVGGRVELQLGADFFIQVKGNSQVTYLNGNGTETSAQAHAAKLSVAKGMVCVRSSLEPGRGSKLVFDIGNTLQATLQDVGDVCLKRNNETSSVFLWSGSIRIEHYTSGHKIVLSQAGTELRAKDEGEYQLLRFNEADTAILEGEEIATSEEMVTSEEIATDEIQPNEPDNPLPDNNAMTEEPVSTEVDSTALQKRPEFDYIVYFFSYASEKRAEKTNSKFHEAGYKTQIYEYKGDETSYYRIALPGFESRQAAEQFSESMIGKLNIKDTWIDKIRLEQ